MTIFQKRTVNLTSKIYVFGLFFASKKAFSKKYGFWRFVRKSLLGNPDILSGYLECSPDSGLSFPNFRMVIRLLWRILSMKNENIPVFPNRDVVEGVCKGLKKVFSKIYDCWRFVRKSLLGNPDILSGYQECSSGSRLSFPNFRIVIYNTLEEFYRWKTKIFQFFQKETLWRRL